MKVRVFKKRISSIKELGIQLAAITIGVLYVLLPVTCIRYTLLLLSIIAIYCTS
jgi:hypothetical protein